MGRSKGEINLEDVPYPHPVQFLDRNLFGQDVRIAYMDVAPVGEPNGRTVMLLHVGLVGLIRVGKLLGIDDTFVVDPYRVLDIQVVPDGHLLGADGGDLAYFPGLSQLACR